MVLMVATLLHSVAVGNCLPPPPPPPPPPLPSLPSRKPSASTLILIPELMDRGPCRLSGW